MRVFIYATEGIYQGLHGISDQCIMEIKDIEEARYTGIEMAENLIYSYGLEDDYFDEDGEYITDPEFDFLIHKIRDDVKESIDELDNIAFNIGYEEFIRDYCEEEELY